MRSRLDFKEDSKILQNLSTDAFATFYVLRTLTEASSELIEEVLTWIEKNQSHDAYSLALAALTNLIENSSDSFLSRILPLCVSALQDKSFHSRRVGASLLHNLLLNLTMRKARSNGSVLKSLLPKTTTALRDILRDRSGKDEEVDRNFLLCLSRVTYVSVAFLRVQTNKDEKMVGMLGRFERLRGGWTRDVARVLRKMYG